MVQLSLGNSDNYRPYRGPWVHQEPMGFVKLISTVNITLWVSVMAFYVKNVNVAHERQGEGIPGTSTGEIVPPRCAWSEQFIVRGFVADKMIQGRI